MSTRTAFTSGKRAELGLPLANHDQRPWINEDDVRERRPSYIVGFWPHREPIHAPSPEFDVPENPILSAFRDSWPDRLAEGARLYLSDWEVDDFPYDVNPEQRDHAFRVLSKLAAIA